MSHEQSHTVEYLTLPGRFGTKPGDLANVDFPALLLLRGSWIVRWISRTTFFFLVVAVFGMLLLPWQQTSRGYGRVVAFDPLERAQKVKATAKGIVLNVREGLREGTFVKKDEVVLALEPFARDAQQQLEMQLTQAKAKLTTAEAKESLARQAIELQQAVGRANVESAKESVEAAKAKVKQAEEKVAGYRASVARTRADFERSTRLYAEGLKSQKDLIKDQENFLKAEADFEEGEQAVIEALKNQAAKEQDYNGKLQEVEVKNREAEGKLEEAKSEVAISKKEISELEVKMSELGHRLEVKAPRDGYLHEIFGLTGSEVVKEGDELFTIVPDAQDLAVEMLVRGNDIPLLHIGDEVRLQFEGYPAIQFIGWPSAAQGTFGGRIALINPTDDGQGNFRVVVTPDKEQDPWPDNRYLRQGVLANGWVLLSTHEGKLSQVPLGFEIWRQLNGFPPVVSDKPPKDDPMGVKGSEKTKIKLPK